MSTPTRLPSVAARPCSILHSLRHAEPDHICDQGLLPSDLDIPAPATRHWPGTIVTIYSRRAYPPGPCSSLLFNPTYGCPTGRRPRCRLKDVDCMMTVDRKLAFISHNTPGATCRATQAASLRRPPSSRPRVGECESACETSTPPCCQT